MSYEMQYRPQTALQTPEQKQMGLFLHLSQLINAVAWPFGIVLSVILWQTQKDKMPALDAHGKMVVNWTISATIYGIISVFLIFVFFLGILTGAAVWIMAIVFPIVGGIKANNGEFWEYPLTIKFIK